MGASGFMRKLAGTTALCAAAVFGMSGALAKGVDPGYAKQQDATIGQVKGALPASTKTKIQFVDVENCYSCHKDIKEFHMGSKHADVNCAYCHSGADEHLKLEGKPKAPTTAPWQPRRLPAARQLLLSSRSGELSSTEKSPVSAMP